LDEIHCTESSVLAANESSLLAPNFSGEGAEPFVPQPYGFI
jgi:hypothetical protein